MDNNNLCLQLANNGFQMIQLLIYSVFEYGTETENGNY